MKQNFRKAAAFFAVFSIAASAMLYYPEDTFHMHLMASATVEDYTVSAGELNISTAEAACDFDIPDNDELFAGYVEKMFYERSDVSTFSIGNRTAGSQLTGDARIIYDALATVIPKIASGERTSTVIRIGIDAMGDLADVTPDDAFTGTFDDLFNGAAKEVLLALLADYPYEMYWFDKTVNIEIGGYNYSDKRIAQCYFKLPVVPAYAKDYDSSEDAGNFTTDASLTSAASTAVTNAKKIVADNAELLDHEKLEAYKDAICDAVEYNDEAAADETIPYGNPFQLIWVFDGDAATSVVCEGYSKAFQYLCDMTEFSNAISCYTVSGYIGEGHMWNIVTMEDGKNYHVDITNCDGNTVGNDGSLFLAGTTTGSVADGYTFNAGTSREITYTYDETDNVWGEDILTLAESDYEWNSPAHTHTRGAVPIYGAGSQEGYHRISYACEECPFDYIFTGGEEACSGIAADCITSAYCNSCKRYYGDPLGHSMTKTEQKAVSCTENGNNEYYTCGTCHKVFKDEAGVTETTAEAETIFTSGHDYVDGICESCGEYEDGIGAKLAGYTVVLNGDIGMNFYMELSDEVINNTEAYMLFTLPDGSTETVPVSDAAENTSITAGKTYYLFACEVASDEMTGEIKAQIIVDEETKSTEYTYTVRDYAEYIINHPDKYTEGDVAFAEAMLNYGANSQLLFGTDIENLANASLDEKDKDVSGVTAESLSAYKVTSVGNDVLGSFVGSNLVLDSETTLKVYFRPAETILSENLTFTIDGQSADAVKSGAYYVISIENIKAYDLDKSYMLKVTDNNGSELTFSTNAMAYCYNVLSSNEYSQELRNLVAALRIYNEASEIYAAS